MEPITNASSRALRPKLISRMLGAGLGEVLVVLWLSVKGVDEKRWHEQATAGLHDYGRAA